MTEKTTDIDTTEFHILKPFLLCGIAACGGAVCGISDPDG